MIAVHNGGERLIEVKGRGFELDDGRIAIFVDDLRDADTTVNGVEIEAGRTSKKYVALADIAAVWEDALHGRVRPFAVVGSRTFRGTYLPLVRPTRRFDFDDALM